MARIPFKVSARTARLIGRENVSNADGALIELIKNSYDAGASACIVIFDCHEDNKDKAIYIIDNGQGMDDKIIESNWMTIGTDNKEHNFIGEDGRIKSGAKGIGRFALDRLGNRAEMITLPKNSESAYTWDVNWDDFENVGLTIEEVYANIEEAKPGFFFNSVNDITRGFNCRRLFKENTYDNGTIIKITELRDQWSDYFIDKINTNFEILVPIKDQSLFELHLFSRELPNKYGQINSLVEYDYDYKIKAVIHPDKTIKMSIYRNELDFRILDMDLFNLKEMKHWPYDIETFKQDCFEKITTVEQLLPNYEKSYNKNVLESLGGFEFTMFFIKRSFTSNDRKKFFYRNFDVRNRAKWMDIFAGIKVYRDYFRVRPYGEMEGSSFDWLMLGDRAAKSPAAPTHPTGSWRVKPNQISGNVFISRINNISFEDKSSREGFQENNAFLALKELIKKIIQEFEYDRQYIMRSLDRLYTAKNLDEQDKKKANQIANQIVKRLDDKVTEENIVSFLEGDSTTLSVQNVGILAKSYLAQIKTNKDLINENQLLRALASTGLTLTSFAHDLNNLSSSILQRNENLKKVVSKLLNAGEISKLRPFQNPFVLIDDMAKQDVRLNNWLEFSINTIKVDKRTRKKIDLIKYFEEFERTWKPILDFQNVNFIAPSNKDKKLKYFFKLFEIDFDSIFNNLISNSLTAFKREDASDERLITINLETENNEIIIIYADSGPGLSKDIVDSNRIFDPLYTTKRDELGKEVGTGLGMWIVRSSVDNYNGIVKIIKERPGFSLRFAFPTRKDEGDID